MPWFEGTYTETVDIDAPLDVVRQHFADLSAIVAQTNDIERHAIDGDTIHFVLREQNHGIAKLQPDFRCRYQLDGDRLHWATVDGNTHQDGEARFSRRPGGGTAIAYRETIRLELGVPKLMAPVLRPVIAQVIAHEVKGFLRRMVDAVPRG